MIPVLPDSAPFSPTQRAWLNGFLAGLLNSNSGGTTASASAGAQVLALPGGSEAANGATNGHAAEEEFPWHDAALPLAERMTLADGKPLERRMMAAMAQLDCGACGYLCQTYSEALARGEEKDCTRCTPGGKDTSRKLKELLAERTNGTAKNGQATNGHAANGSANGHANGHSVPSSNGQAAYDRQRPFAAKLISATPLNRPGSEKDTRHIAIDLSGSGLVYKPGDALGVYPENCPQLAADVLTAAGLTPEPALLKTLQTERSLQKVSEPLLELLALRAADPHEAKALSALAAGAEEDWLEQADVLDLFTRFPSARPAADEFLAALAPLTPRLYSISSSLRAHPGEVHLTVGVVRYRHGDRQRLGVCSTYLGERLAAAAPVRVFLQAAHAFGLPADPETPIIMIGPGTGVAPFRAFLEERAASGARGANWLFFGDQRSATDFLYEAELTAWQASGLLTRLDTAFSRDTSAKVYVQQRMLEQGAELFAWLERGAHVYVCGDARRMAVDVNGALEQIIAEHGGRTPAEAKEYLKALSQAKRYQRDVY